MAIFATTALLGIPGCGDDNSDDIPAGQAEEMLALIDSVRSRVEAGACDTASTDASNLSVAIDGLDRERVPEDVMTALTQGSERLQALVGGQCSAEPDGTTSTTTTTADTTTTGTTTTATTTTTTTSVPDDDDDGDGGENGGTGGTGAGGTEAPGGQGSGGGD